MNIFSNLKNAFSSFGDDNAPTLAASLSYYTVFSLGPLLLIVISLLGFFFGKSAVEGEIIGQIRGLVGTEAARTIESIIAGAQKQSTGIISLIIGIILLALSASGVFGQLKSALNQIWSIEPKPGRGIFALIRERFLSFAMVVVIAFLLGVSLVLTSFLSILNSYFQGALPLPEWIYLILNEFLTFWIIMLLFALIYKVLPDVKPEWRVVWSGATVGALLFVVGKSLIGIYIGNSAAASTYGAASSLVVILLWVYYSSLILLFGAEYVKAAAAQANIFVPVEKYAYKTKAVRVDTEREELSGLEQYATQLAGMYFASVFTPILERIFQPRRKSFWDRVEEKLKE